MSLPKSSPRRTSDIVSNTVVSVVMIAGSTLLGLQHVFSPEGVLAAYGLAGAVGGLPIVVKRSDGSSE